ncbi:MAG: hypothetical protein ACRCT6_02140 [Notoacmeibacter sp.]
MVQFISGLLFLSGLPICMFVLPSSWWPWSTFVWFIGFVAFEQAIHNFAVRWRNRPIPAGLAGVAVSVAISIDDASASGSDGGDGGGGGD